MTNLSQISVFMSLNDLPELLIISASGMRRADVKVSLCTSLRGTKEKEEI